MSLTTTSDSIQNQAAQNCISLTGYPYYQQQPVVYDKRAVSIECVANGFIIKGFWKGKGDIKCVANDLDVLVCLLKDWSDQFAEDK